MLEAEEIDKVSVDADQADALLHLLDAVVIKLEGGTDEDLQVLDVKQINTIITKDTIKDKEDIKSKTMNDKRIDNRYGLMFVKRKKKKKIWYDFEFCSDMNKIDEASRIEKNLKNGQNADTEDKNIEKDETLTEETEKVEENTEETKKEGDLDNTGISFVY